MDNKHIIGYGGLGLAALYGLAAFRSYQDSQLADVERRKHQLPAVTATDPNAPERFALMNAQSRYDDAKDNMTRALVIGGSVAALSGLLLNSKW